MDSPHPKYPEVAPIDVVLSLLPDVDRGHVPYMDGSERLRLTHVRLDSIRGLGDLELAGVEDDPRILAAIEDGSLPPLLVYKDGSTHHVPYNEGWRQAAVAQQHGIIELPAYLFDPEEHATTPDVRVSMSLNPEALARYPKQIDGADLPKWVPGAAPQRGITFTLMTVPISVLMQDDNEAGISGEEWDQMEPKGHPRAEWTDSYADMGQAVEDRGDVPPVVVQKRMLGSQIDWYLMDGFHRVSIALHVGLTELPAYVWDTTRTSHWKEIG